jgi:hypothetical protein
MVAGPSPCEEKSLSKLQSRCSALLKSGNELVIGSRKTEGSDHIELAEDGDGESRAVANRSGRWTRAASMLSLRYRSELRRSSERLRTPRVE